MLQLLEYWKMDNYNEIMDKETVMNKKSLVDDAINEGKLSNTK